MGEPGWTPSPLIADAEVRLRLRNAAKAQADYLDAQARRRGAVHEALEGGCSYREVAEAMRLSVSTVYNLRPGSRRG